MLLPLSLLSGTIALFGSSAAGSGSVFETMVETMVETLVAGSFRATVGDLFGCCSTLYLIGESVLLFGSLRLFCSTSILIFFSFACRPAELRFRFLPAFGVVAAAFFLPAGLLVRSTVFGLETHSVFVSPTSMRHDSTDAWLCLPASTGQSM